MQQRTRFLIASDMDGTLIPQRDTEDARRQVARFARTMEAVVDHVTLAYVTGRHLELALKGVERWGLPVPAYLVCDVGTAVYRREEGSFVGDGTYAALMRAALGGADAGGILRCLEGVADLKPQDAEQQSAFKASFTFPWDRRGEVEEAVAERLRQEDRGGEPVVSHDPVTGHGILDVLPPGGSKDRAVVYLAEMLGVPLDQAVFAGDSGNDRGALLSGVRGIVVGNASEDLRSALREEWPRRGLEDRLYMAEGEAAAGVLEGLIYWGVVEG